VCFLQLLRALIAADFNGPAADIDLDGIRIQLAIASGTSCRDHDIVLLAGSPAVVSRPHQRRSPLSESLAIYLNGF
jgi:hypothetical protein